MSLGITQLKAGASRNGGGLFWGRVKESFPKTNLLIVFSLLAGEQTKSAVRGSIQKLILTRLSGVLEA